MSFEKHLLMLETEEVHVMALTHAATAILLTHVAPTHGSCLPSRSNTYKTHSDALNPEFLLPSAEDFDLAISDLKF